MAVRALVCIDATPLSRAVVPAAQRVAELTGARLEFLHVFDARRIRDTPRGAHPGGGSGDPIGISGPALAGRASRAMRQGPASAEDRGRAIARMDAQLREELEAELRHVPGFACVTIRHGHDPAAAIIEHARTARVDVIAMATHARRGVGQMVAGSTTQAVIRSGVAPVLVVHPAQE